MKNGAIPLKIFCIGTSGNIDFMINTLRPIGGVIRLISTTITRTIPNQIRLKPKASTTGTNMGTVRKIIASAVFLDFGIVDAITDKHREYPASYVIPVNPK